MGTSRLSAVFGLCALSVACAGKSVQEAAPESVAGAGSTAAGQAKGGASNGALTPELSATGLPLDSVLGKLDGDLQAALCEALGKWTFRMRDPSCNAFVESAVVSFMPQTTEEARQLCMDSQDICRKPTEPSPSCVSFPAGCTATLAELDRCIADSEQWLDAVPTCETMTLATAPTSAGPAPDSCATVSSTTCSATR